MSLSIKEKSILFNTEMVKAILDNKKTQTRRVVKKEYLDMADTDGNKIYVPMKDGGYENILNTSWKKYKVGDILYVRETFVLEGMTYDDYGNIIHHKEPIVHYKADNEELSWMDEWEEECNIPWKPSIHMPKEYARIFLKVTNVRIEKLRDISYGDVIKEAFNPKKSTVNPIQDAQDWFRTLWNSTTKDGYKWEDNPYVFVYEFERIEK